MQDCEFSVLAAAGAQQNISAKGNYVRYDRVTNGATDNELTLKIVGGGGGSIDMKPGQWVKLPQEADVFRVENKNGTQAIIGKLKIGSGEFGDQNVSGTITNLPASQGAFVNAQETVTNASTTIIAANAARRYLLIQNNDPTGIIYVRLDGGVATAVTGVKLMPGESYEAMGYVPNGAITAIGDIASNANVVGVEG